MPQRFTNTWDDSYPPDKSAAANQLGVYLRALKTDTQQRMAVISGSQILNINPFPNFQNDVQPGSWDGVLYFETNSPQPRGSNVYQLQNPTSPTFVSVPGLLGPIRFGGLLNVTVPATTGRSFVTFVTMPAGTMTANGGRRVRVTLTMGIQPSGPIFGPLVEIVLATGINAPGVSLALGLADFRAGFTFPLTGMGYIWGGIDTPTTQVWMANNSQRGSEILGNLYLYNSINGAANEGTPVHTSFDLTQTLYFNLYVSPTLVTDVYTIELFGVEVL